MKHTITASVFLGEGVADFTLYSGNDEPVLSEVARVLSILTAGCDPITQEQFEKLLTTGALNFLHFIEIAYVKEE